MMLSNIFKMCKHGHSYSHLKVSLVSLVVALKEQKMLKFRDFIGTF